MVSNGAFPHWEFDGPKHAVVQAAKQLLASCLIGRGVTSTDTATPPLIVTNNPQDAGFSPATLSDQSSDGVSSPQLHTTVYLSYGAVHFRHGHSLFF